jgi:hypothetical protein
MTYFAVPTVLGDGSYMISGRVDADCDQPTSISVTVQLSISNDNNPLHPVPGGYQIGGNTCAASTFCGATAGPLCCFTINQFNHVQAGVTWADGHGGQGNIDKPWKCNPNNPGMGPMASGGGGKAARLALPPSGSAGRSCGSPSQ